MVFRQVPGQRVTRRWRVGHRTQIAGALLRRSPDQRPPLGLVLHLLHSLDGHREDKRTNMELQNKADRTEQVLGTSLKQLCGSEVETWWVVYGRWMEYNYIMTL